MTGENIQPAKLGLVRVRRFTYEKMKTKRNTKAKPTQEQMARALRYLIEDETNHPLAVRLATKLWAGDPEGFRELMDAGPGHPEFVEPKHGTLAGIVAANLHWLQRRKIEHN